jgi:magnesium and cobalt transporter
MIEPRIIKSVHHVAVVAKHLAPHHSGTHGPAVGSRTELLHIIDTDSTFLSTQEKQQVQAALAFGDVKISDVMVPRDNIATVNIKETVGPILLDRLHKDGHSVFVVVKKDIDDIKGLLYMADATSGHPDIKTVKDALRPSVPYVPADAPLGHILGAALSTGRQFFIATDGKGKTLGLITLADALHALHGRTIEPVQTYRSPDFAE